MRLLTSFFFEIILAILGPLYFHINVRISLSVSGTKIAAKDYIESIVQFGDNGHLNNTKSSDL